MVRKYKRSKPMTAQQRWDYNQEQEMIRSAIDITGKQKPAWLEEVFDAENRLLAKGLNFARGYEFPTERRSWQVAELLPKQQELVYAEASKLSLSAIEHLDIIVEKGVLV